MYLVNLSHKNVLGKSQLTPSTWGLRLATVVSLLSAVCREALSAGAASTSGLAWATSRLSPRPNCVDERTSLSVANDVCFLTSAVAFLTPTSSRVCVVSPCWFSCYKFQVVVRFFSSKLECFSEYY
jgi:hypothetical protein